MKKVILSFLFLVVAIGSFMPILCTQDRTKTKNISNIEKIKKSIKNQFGELKSWVKEHPNASAIIFTLSCFIFIETILLVAIKSSETDLCKANTTLRHTPKNLEVLLKLLEEQLIEISHLKSIIEKLKKELNIQRVN